MSHGLFLRCSKRSLAQILPPELLSRVTCHQGTRIAVIVKLVPVWKPPDLDRETSWTTRYASRPGYSCGPATVITAISSLSISSPTMDLTMTPQLRSHSSLGPFQGEIAQLHSEHRRAMRGARSTSPLALAATSSASSLAAHGTAVSHYLFTRD